MFIRIFNLYICVEKIMSWFAPRVGKELLKFDGSQIHITKNYGNDVWIAVVYDDSGAHGEPITIDECHHFINGKAICGWNRNNAKTYKREVNNGISDIKEALREVNTKNSFFYFNPFRNFCHDCLMEYLKIHDKALHDKVKKELY